MYDVIVIGGGPAGLTAGIYIARANKKVLVLEKETIGGQIASSPMIENYPGFSKISGAEFASNLYDQVIDLGGEIDIGTVTEIEDGKVKKVHTEDYTYEAKSVIIATGVRHNRLGLPLEESLIGKGIHFCATCDGAFYKDRDVAIVGGANTAVTNALFLSELARKVYVIYRGKKLKCEEVLEKRLQEKENVSVMYDTVISKIIGKTDLEGIEVTSENGREILNISGLFLAIGMEAESTLASSILDRDEDDYFITDETKTKREGIFVAGDCRSKKVRQLTTATSDGTIAAINALDYLKTIK